MNISLILFNKTLSMLLMALIGYVLVKRGLLNSGDKRALNIINLYAVSPCVILTAFQVALTPDKVTGLITAFAGAISVHVIFLLLARLLVRPLGLNQAEQASLIYSNAGNMILPLVSTILGEEYTLYACAYMAVQNVIIWSHGVMLLSGSNELIHTALLATLLAASAPVASNVTMLALLYDGDVKSASRINVMTLFFCAFTMPLMVLVYQSLC